MSESGRAANGAMVLFCRLYRLGAAPLRRVESGFRVALRAAPAPLLVLLAIVFIHLGVALATTLFFSLGVMGSAFVRIAFTALVLLALSQPRPSRLSGDSLLWVVLTGFAIAGLNLFFYQAVARLPLGVVVMIEFLGPLGVAVVASRRAREYLWIVLAVGGILLLAPLGEIRIDGVGFAFALAAGVCWAAYIVFGGRLGRQVPGGEGLALAMTVAALVLLPSGLASGGLALLLPKWLVIGFVVALVSTVIPFSLEFEAMRRMSPRAFGVLLSSEPAVAALVGVAFLGDRLNLQQLAALLLISVAAVGSTLAERGEERSAISG